MAKCIHPNCNREGFIKISMPDRGGRAAYVCEHHAHLEESYSTENGFRYGNVKVNGFTYSIELETAHSTIQSRGELLNVGYIPTQDGTVDVEYKSPIYEGLNAPSKHAVTVENLMQKGILSIDESCGTHFHVGHHFYINPVTMRFLRRFNHSLFMPLSLAIQSNPYKSEAFFGRIMAHWAQPITAADPAGDVAGWQMKHEAFINLQHDYTIEFRQPRFQTAEQYQQVMRFCKDCTTAIITNFILHFNDEDFDKTRYPNQTAYRRHKANVTAAKLVKLYTKYTANI